MKMKTLRAYSNSTMLNNKQRPDLSNMDSFAINFIIKQN